MPGRRNSFSTRTFSALGLFAIAFASLCGCGGVSLVGNLNPEILTDCPNAATGKTAATDAILLEWGGGVTRIYPGDDLAGLDLSVFLVADGTTLADEADAFKSAVLEQVNEILCDMPTDGVFLSNSKAGLPARVSTVYYSHIGSPLGGSQIGQGEYDPCNERHDNHAIVFGDAILNLGDFRPFDEWVTLFANVTAHEIGHMLGYGHVERPVYAASQRPAFVELMMATHTVQELTSPQRHLADESNCPADRARSRIVGEVLTCGHE